MVFYFGEILVFFVEVVKVGFFVGFFVYVFVYLGVWFYVVYGFFLFCFYYCGVVFVLDEEIEVREEEVLVDVVLCRRFEGVVFSGI